MPKNRLAKQISHNMVNILVGTNLCLSGSSKEDIVNPTSLTLILKQWECHPEYRSKNNHICHKNLTNGETPTLKQ